MCKAGKFDSARSFYTEALVTASDDRKQFIAICLDGFAALALESGELKRAALLAGASESLCAEIGYELEAPDRLFREKYLSALKKKSDAEIHASNIREGRSLSIAEAITLALYK